MDSDRVILTCTMVTLTSTTAAHFLPKSMGGKGEAPPVRMIFGSAITFTGLAMVGEFAPEVATGLSISLALTAMTYYGLPLLSNWLEDTNKYRVGFTPNKK